MDTTTSSYKTPKGLRHQLPSLKNVLRLAAQVGIAGGKTLFTVLLAFGLVNMLLMVYGLFRSFTTVFSWTNVSVLVFTLLLGVSFTLIACYLTYRYILLLMIQNVYDRTLEQRIKISEDVIRQVGSTFRGEQEFQHKPLSQVVDWSKTVYHYYQAVPVFFQSGITQYLNRIPIANYLMDLKEDILAGNQSIAAEKFRISIDTFFEERLLGSPSNRWTWVLFILNTLVLYGIITWGMGAF